MNNCRIKVIIIATLFLLFNSCLYSQIINFGISSSMGYDFYHQNRGRAEVSDFYNPNISLGLIAELQTDEEFFFSFGCRIIKSQRRYSSRSSFFNVGTGFTDIRIYKVDKGISTINLYSTFGYKFKKIKLKIGANYSRINDIYNNGSSVFRLTSLSPTTGRYNVQAENAPQVRLITEIDFILYKNINLTISYQSFKSKGYRSNFPRRRFTFGIYYYLNQNN